MAFPTRLLDDHESITVDLHPHGWFLVPPIVAVVVAVAGGIATLRLTDVDTVPRTVATWLSIAAIGSAIVWLVVRYARWLTTHFVVTDRRIIFRAGLFTKRGVEIPLDRVNTVHFSQGLFERMVGAGDLLIESGGESGQQHFTDIRQPDRVQGVIHAEMDRRRHRDAPGAVVDVADQLEKLEVLLSRGTITPEEFDRQKRRLLGA
jgi:uncharacterized membrane protein YdbT with pleckstrin-like domain